MNKQIETTMATKATYKRLGDYIQLVDVRNRDLKVEKLVGLTIDKSFIPSVANVIGTDLSNYKILKFEQFACSLMQVSRDGKMPIAMCGEDSAIMSPAYPMFEVIDKSILMPEYLMMWFSRSEYDREASFYAVGGVRGSLTWDDFCDMTLPIPPIEEQRKIVAEYQALVKRIEINNQLIAKLEDTAQAIYRNMFVDGIDKENLPEGWRMGTIEEFCKKVTSGGTPNRAHVEYWNKQEIPWLKSGEVHNNVLLRTEEYISKDGMANSSAKLIPKDSVIMAMYGATAAQVGYLTCELTTNQACCNMICHSKVDAAYLYFHLLYNQEEIKRLANGGAQENLSQDLISQQSIIICKPTDVFAKFIKQIELQSREIEIITELQSLLLAKMGQ